MARKAGKSTSWTAVAEVVKELKEMMSADKKILWEKLEGNQLRAYTTHDETLWLNPVGLKEKDMDPIQEWCKEHTCGVRTSFDTFKFRSEKEMMVFLLRWG